MDTHCRARRELSKPRSSLHQIIGLRFDTKLTPSATGAGRLDKIVVGNRY
ncbi:MAG: hypothetical protein ABI893_07240 [Polaromonas sp.]